MTLALARSPRRVSSEFTNREKTGRRGLEFLLRMRVPSSAGVVTTARRAIRPVWSRRHYDDYAWESLFKKVRFWVQITSFFILYRLSTIFANKFSIHTWMTRERDEQTALFWVHISMTTTPRASKLISFKSIAELKEFTGFVGQFVILFSTWTYSLFTTTTVLYTRKSFQVKRFNSQFVNSFWFAKARVFSGR